MKKILFLLLSATLLFSSSCKKSKCEAVLCYNGGTCDEATGNCLCPSGFSGSNCYVSAPACQTNNWGTVRVNSSHSDAYYIYINGVYKGTQGYGSTNYNYISAGYVSVEEKQVNYTFFQNTYNQTGNLTACGTTNANF